MAEQEWRAEWVRVVKEAESLREHPQGIWEVWPAYGQGVSWQTVLAADEALRAAEDDLGPRRLSPVNVGLLRSLMHAVQTCDEEATGPDQLCDCARTIGVELRRLERRAQRAIRRAEAAERERDELRAALEAVRRTHGAAAWQIANDALGARA